MTTAQFRQDARLAPGQFAASKVPAITVYFWIIKVLTTGMGETTSDYLVHNYNPYYVVVLTGIAFGLALVLQLAVRRYVTWVYWLTVGMVSVFGTMVADVTHIEFGVPYYLSTCFYAVVLV